MNPFARLWNAMTEPAAARPAERRSIPLGELWARAQGKGRSPLEAELIESTRDAALGPSVLGAGNVVSVERMPALQTPCNRGFCI